MLFHTVYIEVSAYNLTVWMIKSTQVCRFAKTMVSVKTQLLYYSADTIQF